MVGGMVVVGTEQVPAWFFVISWLELAFVACFFVTEVVRFVLRRRLGRRERMTDVVPTERYLDRFFRPMTALLASVPLAIGVNLLTDGDVSPLGQYAGLVGVVVSLLVVGNYLHRDTTDALPRPGPRARLRRALAQAGEDVDAIVAAPASRASASTDLVRLRARLTRIRGVGARLERRAGSWSWWDLVRREKRWFVVVVTAAGLLPLVTLLWAWVRDAREGQRPDAAASGLLAGLVAATVVAAVLRSVRSRRDLHDLGVELQTTGERLLARLPRADPPPPLPPPTRRVRSVLRDLLHRSLGLQR